MRPERKGLCEDEVRHILQFDWDGSCDEEEDEDVEDISDILQKSLEEVLERGEAVELDLIENLVLGGDERTENFENIPEVTESDYEKINLKTLRWRKKSFETDDITWKGNLGDEYVDFVKTPIEYFTHFFDNEVINLLTTETNSYGLQEFGIELKCTTDEMRRYIGILLYLGVVKLPQMRMAWSTELNLAAITDALSRSRFDKIKESIHFSDKSKQPEKGDPNYDKLYKIRPLLTMLKNKFNALPQEEHQSVDEQIIAYKGNV